jgi:hypothetical protein
MMGFCPLFVLVSYTCHHSCLPYIAFTTIAPLRPRPDLAQTSNQRSFHSSRTLGKLPDRHVKQRINSRLVRRSLQVTKGQDDFTISLKRPRATCKKPILPVKLLSPALYATRSRNLDSTLHGKASIVREFYERIAETDCLRRKDSA